MLNTVMGNIVENKRKLSRIRTTFVQIPTLLYSTVYIPFGGMSDLAVTVGVVLKYFEIFNQ